MKKLYFIAATATMLAACTSNETLKEAFFEDNETELIGFETYHEKSTRAAVTDRTGLTDANGGFGVYGFKHKNNRTATEGGAIDLSDTDPNPEENVTNVNYVTSIFDNVKVWYEAGVKTKDFTYAVPKYWDKEKFYTFFAYAPYAAKAVAGSPAVGEPGDDNYVAAVSAVTGIAFDQATGKFTRNDIKALQDASNTTDAVSVSSGYDPAQSRTKYGTADESNITDYLIAPYVPSQKSGNTNQIGKSYDGKGLTVGFTFYHILSKLNVFLKAKVETGEGGHGYKGVKFIKVTNFNITNLPNNASTIATYAQTSVTASTGTFTPANYSTSLNIISGDNATSTAELYILDGGDIESDNVVNPASYIDQEFHYFVAPNTPATDNKHELNIDYTITYVDGTEEPFTRTIDLSDADNLTAGSVALATMVQNYIYNITVTISLNQIYLTVDEVKDWEDEEQDTGVEIQ